MIDERMEEQASLHVLGALTEAEANEFKKAMEANPELKEFVARLSIATGALAGSVDYVEPPPQLRAKVLARIAPPQKMVSLPERKSPLQKLMFWLVCGLATCLAVVCALLFSQDGQLRRVVHEQANEISKLNELAQSLQTATNDLQKAVTSLNESNRLANLRISLLSSLIADAPKTVAVTLWDGQRQHGALVVQNLKALPSDKDYELWIIDENKQPVPAGVFHTDASGTLRMDFRPVRSIQTAGQFAVTIEAKGGVDSPTLKNMVLASN